MIDLRPDLRKHFPGDEVTAFVKIMALEGQVYRNLAGRKTLRFTLDGRSYFAKLHMGVGWREILKNLLTLRRPVLGARDEWQAIRSFEQIGVATMKVAGFGERGWLPSHQQSFLITDELVNTISLEDYCAVWPIEPPQPALKRALLEKVAKIAGSLHNHGLNHRDLYICHFLLDPATLQAPFAGRDIRLYLIDLHRVQQRPRTPQRWVAKDLAALHFSSMSIGLTGRDRLRFIKSYCNRPLRQVLADERALWGQVERKARKLALKPDVD